MKDCFYSIIIPFYNSGLYLRSALDSLYNQSFRDFEIILIDDTSSDGSFELAKTLVKEKKLQATVLTKPPEISRGVASSRNLAIRHSKGKWLVFMDSDDVFHPEKLRLIEGYLKENSHVKALCHAYVEFVENDELCFQSIPEYFSSEKITLEELIYGNIICTSTVVLSRQVMLNTGEFSSNLNGVEDYYQWLKILCVTTFYRLNTRLTYYRIAHDSLMGRRRLSYYVDQSHKLYTLFIKNKRLTEYGTIFYETLFFKTMNYYIDTSIKYYGSCDLLRGLFNMIRLGYWKPAFHFFFDRLRVTMVARVITFIKLTQNKN